MSHPKPLEKAIAILKIIDEESYFYMLHRMQPIPLLALANEHNLNSLSFRDERERWHILITPNNSIDLKEFLQKDILVSQEA
jgi:hypothetical protein